MPELYRDVSALAAKLGIEWPRNVLRHSFISYRLPIVKSADAVALEAGNSPAIIFKHYRELATEEEANEWFSISPMNLAKCSSNISHEICRLRQASGALDRCAAFGPALTVPQDST